MGSFSLCPGTVKTQAVDLSLQTRDQMSFQKASLNHLLV